MARITAGAAPPGPSGQEDWLHQVVRLVEEHVTPREVLGALCRQAGTSVEERQLAVFLIEGDDWILTAHGDLHAQSQAVLRRISPRDLSETLRYAGAMEGGREFPFLEGWGRHLVSVSGELMGILICLSPEPALPSGPRATRVETICRLATMALEQRNRIADLLALGAAAAPMEGDSELLMQEVMRMVAHQCAPAEILGLLCRRISRRQCERQIACFLTDGRKWTLEATGDLTPASEEALSRLDAEQMAEALFDEQDSGGVRRRHESQGGWARHLTSGTGELLGLIVGFAGAPMLPDRRYAMRVESICRLATLAIEQRNMMQELAYKADHDPLTGLLNRGYCQRELAGLLQHDHRQGRHTALLHLSLDRFRLMMEVLGSATSNQLLMQVGRRFEAAIGRRGFVAFLGGDEFAVVLAGVQGRGEAGAVAVQLQEAISNPFLVDNHELMVHASIGIACSTAESSVESMERCASLALDQAKRSGQGKPVHFHSTMFSAAPERLEMEKRLHFAIEKGELLLYYQPQVELASGVTKGAEALLRWSPEGLGLVSPGTFIPILEETGLILEVGRWVMGEACRQGREWAERYGMEPLIAVNVTAAEIAQPGFVENVAKILAASGFRPERLEVELTESMLVAEFDSASRVLRDLQAMGIRLSLDDFGTGQSSLAYLHRLPFHTLKIDQSFVRRINENDAPAPIVKSIIDMAAGLGMSTVAEGIETAAQAERLRRMGCTYGQGYLFGRPLAAADFADFFRKQR